MPTQKLLQNTTFNIDIRNLNGLKGYNWCSEIGVSFQNKDATTTIKEIINMIKINNYKFNICIKLNTNKLIYFKL